MSEILVGLNYLYLYIYMIDAFGIVSSSIYMRTIILGLFVIASLINIIRDLVKKRIEKDNLFFTIYAIFFFWIQYGFWSIDITELVMVLYTPIMFLAFSKIKISKRYYEVSTYIYILLVAITYFYTRLILNINNGLVINSCYYLLLCIPAVQLFSSNLTRRSANSLIIVVVLFSMKRTAVIALIILVIINLLIGLNNRKKFYLKKLVFWIPAFCFVIAMIIKLNQIVSSMYNNNVLLRFFANDQSGNSRSDIIGILLNELKIHSSGGSILFGKGLNATILYTGGLTAHNDFIEVMFDYGLFGLLFYLSIYGIMLSKIRKVAGDTEKVSLIYVITLFFIISLSSHLLFIPTYISLLIMNYSYLKNRDGIKEKK